MEKLAILNDLPKKEVKGIANRIAERISAITLYESDSSLLESVGPVADEIINHWT